MTGDAVFISETGVEDCEHATVCEHACRTWCRAYRPRVDRDALLELADEMGRVRSRCGYCNKESDCDWADETVCLESYMDDYAHRIREALGAPGREGEGIAARDDLASPKGDRDASA